MIVRKKFKLDSEEKKIKNNLQQLGEKIRIRAKDSGPQTKQILEQTYVATEGKGAIGYFTNFLKRPAFAVSAILLVLVFVGYYRLFIYRPMRSVLDDPYYNYSGGWSEGESLAGPSMQSTGVGRTAPTFKEKFLSALGSHEASPYEIAKRGPLLEKDLNVEIMTDKKDEADSIIKDAFQTTGGYINRIEPCNSCSRRGTLTVYGKVPADNLESFKAMIKSFVGETKYYREGLNAQSRTADIIAAEKSIKEVEDSIGYLEDALTRETDLKKKAELEKKLADDRAFLAEREETKKQIEERVEFADVYLSVTFLPTFWKASSFEDFKLIYLGFEQPSLLDQFKINATRVMIFLLRLLSYTFWLIPIVIWFWWRRRGEQSLLDELE